MIHLDNLFLKLGIFREEFKPMVGFFKFFTKSFKIYLNIAILFFPSKIYKKKNKYPTLCPTILPLHAQERDMIPLLVYLTPKIWMNHTKISAKPKNTRQKRGKNRELCSLASLSGKPPISMLQIQ
jgi:hypothetical protein